MQKYYYQVLINNKVFPYQGCKIWNRETAEVYFNQAKNIVTTHTGYKNKYNKVELVKVHNTIVYKLLTYTHLPCVG